MNKETDSFDATNFKPLNEGLGLNHFADGLPYTPMQAKKRPSVTFNFPPPRAPKAEEKQPMVKESSLNAPSNASLARTSQTVSANSEAVAATTELPRISSPFEYQPAGFVRRILAFTVDLVLASFLFCAVVWISFSVNGFDLQQLLSSRQESSQMIVPLGLLYVVLLMGYFLVQETTWKSTIGKAFFGLQIRSHSGFAVVGRTLCFLIAAIPFGIGLFWYFFDSRHRCWHDVITDCEVLRIR